MIQFVTLLFCFDFVVYTCSSTHPYLFVKICEIKILKYRNYNYLSFSKFSLKHNYEANLIVTFACFLVYYSTLT